MSEPAARAAAPGEPPHESLEQLCASTRELISASRVPLRRIQVRAGEISIELEWTAPPNGLTAPNGLDAPTGPAEVNGGPLLGVGPDTGPQPGLHFICAPLVGTFYVAPEPGAQPFISVGELVQPGQQVGLVEAMKLMLPVQSDCSGRVVEVLARNGTSVEYGTHLIAVELLAAP
jgi:acetyl-CoA carboxylase biotin carboxyl carrier protein